jgi:hypothetical protein
VADQEKKPEIPRATSPKLTKRSTTYLVALTRMSPRESKN